MRVSQLFSPIVDPLSAWYQRQSAKDQKMLLLLVGFLIVFCLGFAVWHLHQVAEKSAKTLRDEKSLLTWMSGQYSNLNMSNSNNQSLNDQVQTAATGMGLTASVNPQGDAVQVATSHASFAVLGNFLTALAQQGASMDALTIQQQADGVLQLQATLSRK